MTKEYSELIEYLGDNFTKIDESFRNIDLRFEQMDARFNRMDERFDGMDERFDKVEQTLGQHTTQIDNLTKITLDNNQELKVLNHRTDRLEGWAKKVGTKTKVQFNT